MMTLAKASANLVAVLALLFCIGPAGAQTQTKPAKKKAATHKVASAPGAKAKASAVPATAAPAPKTETAANKRDPFAPLIYEQRATGGGEHLPPGKAGLVVATVRVDGTVQARDGMIAMVSNPDKKVYFVREGDRLYDGDVEKIGLDGVTFRESSKDAFGKPVERTVTKRIYASAGEQQ